MQYPSEIEKPKPNQAQSSGSYEYDKMKDLLKPTVKAGGFNLRGNLSVLKQLFDVNKTLNIRQFIAFIEGSDISKTQYQTFFGYMKWDVALDSEAELYEMISFIMDLSGSSAESKFYPHSIGKLLATVLTQEEKIFDFKKWEHIFSDSGKELILTLNKPELGGKFFNSNEKIRLLIAVLEKKLGLPHCEAKFPDKRSLDCHDSGFNFFYNEMLSGNPLAIKFLQELVCSNFDFMPAVFDSIENNQSKHPKSISVEKLMSLMLSGYDNLDSAIAIALSNEILAINKAHSFTKPEEVVCFLFGPDGFSVEKYLKVKADMEMRPTFLLNLESYLKKCGVDFSDNLGEIQIKGGTPEYHGVCMLLLYICQRKNELAVDKKGEVLFFKNMLKLVDNKLQIAFAVKLINQLKLGQKLSVPERQGMTPGRLTQIIDWVAKEQSPAVSSEKDDTFVAGQPFSV